MKINGLECLRWLDLSEAIESEAKSLRVVLLLVSHFELYIRTFNRYLWNIIFVILFN